MQNPPEPALTTAQAATADRVLADLIRSWSDPHRREAVRQVVNLGPGDANEDMQALQAARLALTRPAPTDLQRDLSMRQVMTAAAE